MNTIVTGDNTTKWEDWNFIYAPLDQMKVQPGQPYMPNNCEILIRALPQDNYSKAVSILKFKIEDGVPSLLWENDDPNVTIIKQREK